MFSSLFSCSRIFSKLLLTSAHVQQFVGGTELTLRAKLNFSQELHGMFVELANISDVIAQSYISNVNVAWSRQVISQKKPGL